MEFNVGDVLRVDGEMYTVTGKILYSNRADGCSWHEYRLRPQAKYGDYWLSIDNAYREYSISCMQKWSPPLAGYHLVDSGTERVSGHWGNVDVDTGETAAFEEYEDASEEKIISIEKWSDGAEFSTGYYLDENEIQLISQGNSYASGGSGGSSPNRLFQILIAGVCIIVFLGQFIGPLAISFLSGLSTPSVSDYLKDSLLFTYSTSVTGTGGEKADVYTSSFHEIPETVNTIIKGIDGKTEDVMMNTEDEDGSVGILTKKEYCFVYYSEDNEVLVQVSTRKYVYSSDEDPYHSRHSSRRFYRRHYHTRAYSQDSRKYKKSYNSFSGYNDTAVGSSNNDSFNSYSRSIRQQSTGTRTTSGGGTSYGK